MLNGLDGATQILLLSVIETGIGITAASLTTLRPLFRPLRDGSPSNSQTGTNMNMRRKLWPGLLFGPRIDRKTPDATAISAELQENDCISDRRDSPNWTSANDVDIGSLFERWWTPDGV